MLTSLSAPRRRFLLGVGAVVLLLVVGLTVLVAVRVATGRVRPVAQGVPGPVLLVPGYGGSTGSLAPMVRELQERGRDATVVAAVGSGTGDLRVQAEALAQAAEAAIERTGAASVDVVGYSAGGVVARVWVRDFGGAALARRVFSVGSPQHGTAVAELAVGLLGRCPTACQQLAPDSDLLRALNAGDETPGGPVFASVWSTSDEVVVPPDSAQLAGAVNFSVQSVCPGSRPEHGQLPSDPVVLAALVTVLGPDAPRSPAGPDCAARDGVSS